MKKIIILIMLSLVVSCGNNKIDINEKTVNMPEWFVNPPQTDTAIFGTSYATSKNLQIAIDKAKHEAYTDIAGKMDQRIKAMVKRFRHEIGDQLDATEAALFEQVSKSVINTTLSYATVNKQLVKQNVKTKLFSAYVMTSIPIKSMKQQMVSSIKEKRDLYTKVESTNAFKELSAALLN